jgi:SnoaL-like polyketide cyclase
MQSSPMEIFCGSCWDVGRRRSPALCTWIVFLPRLPKLSFVGTPKRFMNFEAFEELFDVNFVDYTPQPNCSPDRDGARSLYRTLRAAFPDFHADIHWQTVDGELVTTYKTYHGTHKGTFLGLAATGRQIHFETVVLSLAGMPARCGSGVLLFWSDLHDRWLRRTVLTKPWRLLAPIETLTGILMCGLSASFFFAVVVGIDRARHPTITGGSTTESTRT